MELRDIEKEWFYHKIFMISDEEVFKRFKHILKFHKIVDIFDKYKQQDFNNFKFDPKTPYYRITSPLSFGRGSADGYRKFKNYYDYDLISLFDIRDSSDIFGIDKKMHADFTNFGKFGDLYTTTVPASTIPYAPITNELPQIQTIDNTYRVHVPIYNDLNELGSHINLTYDIARDYVDARIAIIDDIIDKKENEMNKILEIYEKRVISKAWKDAEKRAEKIKEKDNDYAAFKKLNNSKIQFTGNFSKEIEVELDKNRDIATVTVAKAQQTVMEVEAQLEICETYEQKINILKLYNVLNEEGKLSI